MALSNKALIPLPPFLAEFKNKETLSYKVLTITLALLVAKESISAGYNSNHSPIARAKEWPSPLLKVSSVICYAIRLL